MQIILFPMSEVSNLNQRKFLNRVCLGVIIESWSKEIAADLDFKLDERKAAQRLMRGKRILKSQYTKLLTATARSCCSDYHVMEKSIKGKILTELLFKEKIIALSNDGLLANCAPASMYTCLE